MKPRAKKILLLLLAAALLFGSGRIEKSLNHDRAALGLTITEPLQDAPPVLAFTTVALGGFRGLISNYLWIRANDLQLADKYFEAAQLASWITDLEPHFAQVWVYQAWNMAFNISVKFKENSPHIYSDRWHWVENGISLLRDEGLRYNPDDILIHRELSWFFQFKMGQFMDDAHIYYKAEWAKEMTPLFGPQGTNVSALVNPQTPEEETNAVILREKYKMNPVFVKAVDDKYGPFDWRSPEAHAIYWAEQGLKMAAAHPDKVQKDDLIKLRRSVFQSMLQAFHHGRYIASPLAQSYPLAPNLEIIPNVNKAYEDAMNADTNSRSIIATAHRNFLRDAVYFLYANNRIADAAKWYKILGQEYPDKPILDNVPDSLPKNLTLDEFAVARIQGELGDTSQERTTGVIQGLLVYAYTYLATGQDDRYEGYLRLARKAYESYEKRIKGSEFRMQLPQWNVLQKTVLDDVLDPQNGMPYAARAVVISQLGLTNALTVSTNSITPAVLTATNAPPNTETNSVIK